MTKHKINLFMEQRPTEEVELEFNFGGNNQKAIPKKSEGGKNHDTVVKIEGKNNKHRNKENTKYSIYF